MFKINQKVVFRGHGLSTIKEIKERLYLDNTKQFYILTVDSNQLTAMVPVSDTHLIRPVATREEAKRVLELISNLKVKPDNMTWNKRYQEYMEGIKTGELIKIAEVFKGLLLLKQTKDLNFGERKMLVCAHQLLLDELGLALELNIKETDALLTIAG